MYTVGIDPGLTETGIVLLAPEGHYLAGLTVGAPKEGPDLQRIVNLADTIVGTVKSWVFDHKIRELLIGVEYPILRGEVHNGFSVETYRKQINLLHEVEAALWRWHREGNGMRQFYEPGKISPGVVHIAEVNPTASKRAATGDGAATKDAMVAASPFQRRVDIRRTAREALADAWAHAIAVRGIAGADRLIELEELVRERLAPKFVDTRVFKVEVK